MPARNAVLVRPAAGAVAFLTRIPLGRLELDGRDVARGAIAFPLVGAAIGALTALVAVGLDGPLTAPLAAGVAVAAEAAFTGAIHLDALADVADGLGARSRERAFEIMREGSIGAFGASALVLDLWLKTLALTALVEAGGAISAVAGAAGLGRAAPLALAWMLPYALAGEGTGRLLTNGSAQWSLGGGLLLALVVALLLVGTAAPFLVAAAAIAAAAVGMTAWRKLGGVTGDVLGASVETATTAALLAAVAAS
jgi:adenosylcobinamide-GDP ribazoletransferase